MQGADRPDMYTAGIAVGATGRVADPHRLQERRTRRGECPRCGVKLFQITGLLNQNKIPLNIPGHVENGRCLSCYSASESNSPQRIPSQQQHDPSARSTGSRTPPPRHPNSSQNSPLRPPTRRNNNNSGTERPADVPAYLNLSDNQGRSPGVWDDDRSVVSGITMQDQGEERTSREDRDAIQAALNPTPDEKEAYRRQQQEHRRQQQRSGQQNLTSQQQRLLPPGAVGVGVGVVNTADQSQRSSGNNNSSSNNNVSATQQQQPGAMSLGPEETAAVMAALRRGDKAAMQSSGRNFSNNESASFTSRGSSGNQSQSQPGAYRHVGVMGQADEEMAEQSTNPAASATLGASSATTVSASVSRAFQDDETFAAASGRHASSSTAIVGTSVVAAIPEGAALAAEAPPSSGMFLSSSLPPQPPTVYGDSSDDDLEQRKEAKLNVEKIASKTPLKTDRSTNPSCRLWMWAVAVVAVIIVVIIVVIVMVMGGGGSSGGSTSSTEQNNPGGATTPAPVPVPTDPPTPRAPTPAPVTEAPTEAFSIHDGQDLALFAVQWGYAQSYRDPGCQTPGAQTLKKIRLSCEQAEVLEVINPGDVGVKCSRQSPKTMTCTVKTASTANWEEFYATLTVACSRSKVTDLPQLTASLDPASEVKCGYQDPPGSTTHRADSTASISMIQLCFGSGAGVGNGNLSYMSTLNQDCVEGSTLGVPQDYNNATSTTIPVCSQMASCTTPTPWTCSLDIPNTQLGFYQTDENCHYLSERTPSGDDVGEFVWNQTAVQDVIGQGLVIEDYAARVQAQITSTTYEPPP